MSPQALLRSNRPSGPHLQNVVFLTIHDQGFVSVGSGRPGRSTRNLQHIPHFFHGTVFDSRLVIGESDDSGGEYCLDEYLRMRVSPE